MAVADYFNKNVQSVGAVLKGLEPDAFKATLEKEIIGIAIDGAAAENAEGRASLDLAIRLIARLYPSIVIEALDSRAQKEWEGASALAKLINPAISVIKEKERVTKWLVGGNTKIAKRAAQFVIYVGSDGWLIKLSTKRPVGSGRSTNPFGAGAAACIGVANLFRATFGAQLPQAKPDSDLCFSVLHLSKADAKAKGGPFKRFNLGEFYLVGVGAIGNGFLWAIGRTDCSGTIHLVDKDVLELGNLQRYAMTTRDDVEKSKVEMGRLWLGDTRLTVHAHGVHWEEYVGGSDMWRFERVAVAVDSERARINIQASLPKSIFNSWTQTGELGLSRHDFVGEDACLACLYMPVRKTLNFDQILARALHLPEDQQMLLELRRRLDLNEPTGRDFLQRVATAASIPIETLVPFEGMFLREFYLKAICGGAVLEFGTTAAQQEAHVPMAFQSALAGILLAADLVADAASLRPRHPTITQIDLLGAVPVLPSRSRGKQPELRCICADKDFIDAYNAKYPRPISSQKAGV